MIKKILFIYLFITYISSLLFAIDISIFSKEDMWSKDSNPSMLSFYPVEKVYLSQNIWGVEEHNFKNNFDTLVDNIRYIIQHSVTATSEKSIKKQQKKVFKAGVNTSSILYDMHTKGSSIYKMPLSSYVGFQWRNLGFSINQETVNGAYFKFGSSVDEKFVNDVFYNKKNYAFWKNAINTIKSNPQNKLHVNKVDISQYRFAYANNIKLPNSSLHFGSSLKYHQSSFYKKMIDIDQISYEQLILNMNSDEIDIKKTSNKNEWGMDVGATYHLNNNKFLISYMAKDIYQSGFSKDTNSSDMDNNSTIVVSLPKTDMPEHNITISPRHIMSIHYKYSPKTTIGLNVDLVPHMDYFNNISYQYIDFHISHNVYKKHKLYMGLKTNLQNISNRLIYKLGYSIQQNSANVYFDYQFSDYNIDKENRKQFDILKLYVSYRI